MPVPPNIEAELPIRIVVLMACHNRAAMTQEFFKSFDVARIEQLQVEFIVTDDGSTDETNQVLQSQSSNIKIVKGSGSLYWAKSMALAEEAILQAPDGILWVNDDLVLNPTAFEKLMRGILLYPDAVLVGQVKNKFSDRIIYGGYRKIAKHPLRLELLDSGNSYLEADTFNGNFVYIPTQIRLAVGSIDGNFAHAYADCDYGYRVANAGFSVRILPGHIGESLNNSPHWPKSRFQKMKQTLLPKHTPIKSQLRFFKKHSGIFWPILTPIYLVRPYFKILFLN